MIENAIKKGFDVDQNAKYVSICYMLSIEMQRLLNEHEEYLKQFGLRNNFRNDFHAANRNFDAVNSKIAKLVDKKNESNLFEDADKFHKIVSNFLNRE